MFYSSRLALNAVHSDPPATMSCIFSLTLAVAHVAPGYLLRAIGVAIIIDQRKCLFDVLRRAMPLTEQIAHKSRGAYDSSCILDAFPIAGKRPRVSVVRRPPASQPRFFTYDLEMIALNTS